MSDLARNTRIIFSLVIFLSMSIWEVKFPKRKLSISKPIRWKINLTLAGSNIIVERLISPLGATGFALLAVSWETGLFNMTRNPPVVAFLVSILVLDLTVYFQHVLFHKHHFLRKIHGVHHTDMDLDITSGIRFHPMEILFSLLLKGVIILLLGCPPVAVLTFEVILNGASLFNHSNVYIPSDIDRFLRLIIVTPDMHRIHHSVINREMNSNYGFSFSWWDRLFGNYTSVSSTGQLKMTLGLPDSKQPGNLPILMLLKLPFIRK